MRTVEVFFDYASPWSYLATELISKKLPGVPIVWRPVYLRGFEPFMSGLPYGPLKLAYLMRDLQRVAAHEGVTVNMPHSFPIDGLQSLRAALLAQDAGPEAFERYHRAMFHATWRDGKDTTKKDVVLAILGEAMGAPVSPEALATSAVKGRLRDATSHAIDRGIFGAPTFAVGDEIFWGLDRADYVLRAAQS
jgi:2-hydroxychromene-2-carboxylate isomerase